MKIMQKQQNHDFVILNLTDPQMSFAEWTPGTVHERLMTNTLRILIERAHPDLITIGGDLSWSGDMEAYERLSQELDKYGIPWAPVWGNHDNQRFDKDAVFHEQILAFTPSGPSFNLKEGNIGLGSLSVDALTSGWEGEHANLSLLDFGHAEVSAEMKDGQVSVGALASIWSPSFSVTFLGVTIELGAEVGAIGADIDIGKKGFKAKGAYAFGASLSVSW